jgi:diguanylate cyclase (GGDEF)-like protein
MASIVRVAVIAVTLALFVGSTVSALSGRRELAILFALATPIGISAWGFSRAGHHEFALVLLCTVMIVVVTLVLILNPLGVHDVVIIAYGGIVAVGALLLTRRHFFMLAALTVLAASIAFVLDLNGLTRSRVAALSSWTDYAQFLVIISVFGVLGRYAAERLFGSIDDLHRASSGDVATGLANRAGFLAAAAGRIKAAGPEGRGVLVLADLDAFRRMNIVIGHRAGDGVLKEVGERLQKAAGEHLVGRIGDDEFGVLATGLDDGQAEIFARSVHRAAQFEFSGASVRASVGFARFPRDANGIDSLLLAAEGSLTRAKDHAHEAGRFAGPSDLI